MCTQACLGAYEDNKRYTCNSLLRVKTPFPKRENREEIAVRVASCACAPFQCLEGLGMIACGAVLWPIPCTVCKIETHHSGTDVSLNKCCLSFRHPNYPVHYSDQYQSVKPASIEGKYMIKDTVTKGEKFSVNINQRPTTEIDGDFHAKSTLTGFQCLTSGIERIIGTFYSVLCCPVNCVCLTCCNKNNPN